MMFRPEAPIPPRTVQSAFDRLRYGVRRRPNTPAPEMTVVTGDSYDQGWGGAGIAFVTARPPPMPVSKEWDFRYDPRFVVTPHAFAVGRLITRLQPYIGDCGYAGNKEWFFGSLGDAVDRLTGLDARASERTTLTAVLDAAEGMVSPEQKALPLPFVRSPWRERLVERPWADARIVTFRNVDRLGSRWPRFGTVFSHRYARREIIELRSAQVGNAGTAANLRAGRVGTLTVGENVTEVRFGFVPSDAEPYREVFERNMMALAQDVAENLGQKEVELWIEGGLIRASPWGDPPPPGRILAATAGKDVE